MEVGKFLDLVDKARKGESLPREWTEEARYARMMARGELSHAERACRVLAAGGFPAGGRTDDGRVWVIRPPEPAEWELRGPCEGHPTAMREVSTHIRVFREAGWVSLVVDEAPALQAAREGGAVLRTILQDGRRHWL